MHTIDLSGFWTASEPAPGRVRWARRFGRPRTLSPGETAWLVGVAGGDGTLTVNGRVVAELVAGAPFAAEVTALLQPRNEAAVETPTAGPGGPAAVRMEIR